MISRLRVRRDFELIARRGTRTASRPLWCRWCQSNEGPLVGYALTRALGTAVTRNRLRRRLRAIIEQIDRTQPLPPVMIMIGAHPDASELTFEELRMSTEKMINEIRQAISR